MPHPTTLTDFRTHCWTCGAPRWTALGDPEEGYCLGPLSHAADDDIDSVEARIDAGDALAESDRCSFAQRLPEGPPCPHEATGVRTLGEVDLPACPFHTQRGGYLHAEAHTAYGRRMIAIVNAESEEAAARLGIDAADTAHRAYPTHCSGCGARLFTGNTSARCSACF